MKARPYPYTRYLAVFCLASPLHKSWPTCLGASYTKYTPFALVQDVRLKVFVSRKPWTSGTWTYLLTFKSTQQLPQRRHRCPLRTFYLSICRTGSPSSCCIVHCAPPSYMLFSLMLTSAFSIRYTAEGRPVSTRSDDRDSDATVKAISQRSYDLCVRAANHIASIITGWTAQYCIRRAPVWLCYNVFTAGIMHVMTCECAPTRVVCID